MWFHLACWGVPLLETVAAAASDSVGGDPVSGICFVAGSRNLVPFVVLPLLAKVIVGAGFLSAGISAIWQVGRPKNLGPDSIELFLAVNRLLPKVQN